MGKEALEGGGCTSLAEGGSSDSVGMVWGPCPPTDAGVAVMGIRAWKQLTYGRKKGWWYFRKLVDGCHSVQRPARLCSRNLSLCLPGDELSHKKTNALERTGLFFLCRSGWRLCTQTIIHQLNSVHNSPDGLFVIVYFKMIVFLNY